VVAWEPPGPRPRSGGSSGPGSVDVVDEGSPAVGPPLRGGAASGVTGEGLAVGLDGRQGGPTGAGWGGGSGVEARGGGARRGKGGDGLVALAQRVFGIEPAEYSAEHGERLLVLVDEAKVSGAKVSVDDLDVGYAAWRVVEHWAVRAELSVLEQQEVLLKLL